MVFISRTVPKFYQCLRALLLAQLAALLLAASGIATAADDDFLPPEQAFRFAATMVDGRTAEVRFDIAPGYYMYRERFAFEAAQARLGQPAFPAGEKHFDETFQKEMETYRGVVKLRIPVDRNGNFTLKTTSQGCSDKGLCYPPMVSSAVLAAGGPTGSSPAPAVPESVPANDSDSGRIERALISRELAVIVPMFLLLGLGLSFTPCVLPMLPILSSIIVGAKGSASRLRGLGLSVSYSFGMAIVYTAMGVAAGLAGEGLAAALQNAWVLGAFAFLMVVLALPMFGVFELQMPAVIQSRLTGASKRQGAGTHAGVFAMGAISALIVGPCVAAPLAGALVYLSQTRDAFIGGSALFAMAAGMSLPLLLVGASAGAFLPRAGAWMVGVKRFFGVLMLGTALWIAAPVLPSRALMLGWGLLGLGSAVSLLLPRPRRLAAVAAGLVAGVLGLTQLAGLAAGGSDPLAPFATAEAHGETPFQRVRSVDELDAILASSPGKTVMLDFYADWCVSCKEMERFTFSDPRVQERFGQMLLLQADVSANNAADQALLKRFGLFGPPGIIFFGADGRELGGTRVIGYEDADAFLASLRKAEAAQTGRQP
ncbi:protein-disulfide reductase DsbD [Massilia sp. MS-15]|uniref:protein-disulfide reductase DsbD n=1 Tax=Massilia sp. MS-15 TaxID=2878200 RepID=UPI001CD6493E|nr:protein-disulfide reductase DsbD [Massilia sp. MS-15]MCA1245940.1 protein-disulfide reductase DsbD [Massilia sp. MS-15]